MLPAGSRLHTSAEFSAVVRVGRRAAGPHLVVHLLIRPSGDAARAGFVVSGKVGNSVVRHRVTRRLRALIRPMLASLPPGTDVVVRARPTAATASSAELGRDLRSAIGSATRKARPAVPRTGQPAAVAGAGR